MPRRLGELVPAGLTGGYTLPSLAIWMIQTGEPLPGYGDPMRTGVLADALAARGHRITWWTSAFDHLRKEWLLTGDGWLDLPSGLRAYAVRGCGYQSNTELRRFLDHRLVCWRWRRVAGTCTPPDVFVVSLPPHDLAAAAIRLARRWCVPAILDLRDPWPDLLLDAIPRRLRWLGRLALASDFRMLRAAVDEADSVVAVTSALSQWGLRRSSRQPQSGDRVFYTGLRRSVAREPIAAPLATRLNAFSGAFIVAFVGTFGLYHAPWVVLGAARRLQDAKIVFVLAGDGQFLAEFRRRAADLPNVLFPGWLGETQAAALLDVAHVGICPATRAVDVLPNKAIAYMRAGLPVVSSFEGDMRQFITERRIGLQYPVGDEAAFTECIRRLQASPALRRQMGRNAAGLFDELFDAAHVTERYADHVEAIAAGVRAGMR